jgi:hypothetical protein
MYCITRKEFGGNGNSPIPGRADHHSRTFYAWAQLRGDGSAPDTLAASQRIHRRARVTESDERDGYHRLTLPNATKTCVPVSSKNNPPQLLGFTLKPAVSDCESENSTPAIAADHSMAGGDPRDVTHPSPAQPPMPHCGRPHVPPAPGSTPALETWPLTTLKSLVSLVLWQWGHTGFSSPRMSSSIFWLHFWQEYSYNGIASSP